jgi:hypothetical protein
MIDPPAPQVGESARSLPPAVPFAGLDCQLPPSLRGQPVELGAAIVFRNAFFEPNPSPFDKPMQRRVQGSLFDLQHLVGVKLDRLGDGVTVHRSQHQGPENQQVQGALQQLDLFFFFGRQPRRSIGLPLVECQGEKDYVWEESYRLAPVD